MKFKFKLILDSFDKIFPSQQLENPWKMRVYTFNFENFVVPNFVNYPLDKLFTFILICGVYFCGGKLCSLELKNLAIIFTYN